DGTSISVPDFGFETLAVGNSFQYNPSRTPWTFSPQSFWGADGSGVSGNGSAFTSGNPDAPQGVQVAFLRMKGSISQTIDLPAGTYALRFQAAQRANFQDGPQSFQVEIDGVKVGGPIQPSGTSYQSYTTDSFTVTAGRHTIAFVGLNPNGGDSTAFLDNVSISSGTLTISAGATVVSANAGSDAITLRGA